MNIKYLVGISIVNESFYCVRIYIVQGHFVLLTLSQIAGEHGSEVGGTGGQHYSVCLRRSRKCNCLYLSHQILCTLCIGGEKICIPNIFCSHIKILKIFLIAVSLTSISLSPTTIVMSQKNFFSRKYCISSNILLASLSL